MGTSSGANFHQQPPPQGMLPPRHGARAPSLQTSLSLASSEQVGSPEMQEPVSNSDQGHDSATESASSRETWPVDPEHSNAAAASSGGAVKKVEMEKDIRNGIPKLQVIRGSSRIDRVSLREIARERVDLVVEKMKVMPEEHLEEIKNELRSILEGTGGSHHIEEFLYLQKFVQGRGDLTPTMLSMAHHVQLEILVAIKTGIQAFLHPSVTIPQSHLVEVFLYKRCRNIACQSALPAEECRCNVCANRNGFCNLCMCVICNKFDFEVNTCRWVGCDFCSHWTHTDCAIRVGQIGTGQSIKSGTGHAEMLFRCQACQKTSELFGWVKDVFQQCAPGWDRDALVRELEFVCKIFRLSEDPKGRNLFRKCANLIERLRNSSPDSVNPRMILHALRVTDGWMLYYAYVFTELEMDSPKSSENEESGRLITPQEACNRIAEVVQEAVRKMELVAEEKMGLYKKARTAVEACDRELDEKARQVQEFKAERLRKKQQVEELESIVRLKQAEAEMFQLKASEARQEAERLQSIALAKSERAEQDYASLYLKRRLEEAEAEKQFLFEKIKLQDGHRPPQASSSVPGDSSQAPSQALMLSKIQDLLKNVRTMPTKSEAHSK
ncbi:hypothetical protein VPH35_088877 [Triticum aestivum]|uniref:OBERON-like protein n=1 Tax=Triticum aestivum TaxID=4565 RepID=A0A3B6LI66_WHEAT